MPSPKKRCIYDHDETQQQSAAMSSKTEEEHLQFELARHSCSVEKKNNKKKNNTVQLQGKFKTTKDAGPARCRDMEEYVNTPEQQLEGCFRDPA